MHTYILIGGLEHEFYFSHHIGNFIIPTVTHSYIFQRGRLNHQPVLYIYIHTHTHIYIYHFHQHNYGTSPYFSWKKHNFNPFYMEHHHFFHGKNHHFIWNITIFFMGKTQFYMENHNFLWENHNFIWNITIFHGKSPFFMEHHNFSWENHHFFMSKIPPSEGHRRNGVHLGLDPVIRRHCDFELFASPLNAAVPNGHFSSAAAAPNGNPTGPWGSQPWWKNLAIKPAMGMVYRCL